VLGWVGLGLAGGQAGRQAGRQGGREAGSGKAWQQ